MGLYERKRWRCLWAVWLGMGASNALALTTQVDGVTMHHGQKAALPVLNNDSGPILTSSLAIASAPVYGTATTLLNGRILYQHTTGTPPTDEFTYQVQDLMGATSSPVTVSITFSAQGRLAATTLCVPMYAPATAYALEPAFPGLGDFGVLSGIDSAPGESNRLFVVERAGRIYAITNIQNPSNAVKLLYLDISDAVTSNNELGMKGLAFHPGFATNRMFYVTYCTTQGTVRLSRFLQSVGNPNAADMASELVMLEQTNDGLIHNIDDANFGNDGYLYVGFGDEDFVANTQVITQDIWSTIIRIDPDKRPGNPEPNPHPAVRTNASGLAYYSIPADNPFLGITQFHGVAVNPATVRTEMFAVGFRNPWQFSFDRETGELWVGDVGNASWEKVCVVTAGWNSGWAYYEGTYPGPLTPPGGLVYNPPQWEYFHDNNSPYGGSAVIGGQVIRGSYYPDLVGAYVFGDFVSGNIWSLVRLGPTTLVQRIIGQPLVSSYAIDPSNESLLMTSYEPGSILRLVLSAASRPFPQKLSETGVFADLSDLAPNPGVVAYGLNLPFWSDYARKQRWFALTNLTDGLGYHRDDPWTTPTGMVWVKHFDMEMDRGNTNSLRRIETRLLVRGTNGTYGVSYRWSTNGSEAFLVPEPGEALLLTITNNGIPVAQNWSFPSRSACLFCHTAVAGHGLSFSARQLNRPGELAGITGNQLDLLAAAGFFTNAVDDARTVPRHVRPGETNFSLEVRARSYLAVNCGYCHSGVSSPIPSQWDGRAHTPLSSCGIIRASAVDNGGNTNQLLVVPGSVNHSIIWNRIAVSNGFTRMPPLASSVTDPEGIQLIADWIAAELPAWRSYADWRSVHFGTNLVAGDPLADPDGDGQNNYNEFLTYGSPTNSDSGWVGGIQRSTTGVEIDYELFNRQVKVEGSPDLRQWNLLPVAGNNGLSLASGTVTRITLPAAGSNTFYRFRVEEQ
jgi:glucose/arabinose dehydrogenase